MTENRDDSLVPWEKALDRLVGMAGSNKKRAFQQPSEAAIRAYLCGTPTQAQKREVRTALSESAEFRAELLEMTEEMEEWADPETAHSAEQVHVDLIPDLKEYLPESRSTETAWNRIKYWLNTPLLLPAAVGRSIAVVLRPRVLAPSLMAAVLVTLIAVQQFQTGPSWELVASRVDKEKLISTNLRQTAPTRINAYQTAEEAALAGFRELLVSEDYKLKFNPAYTPPQYHEPTQTLHLQFTDEGGSFTWEVVMELPIVDSGWPKQVQAWLLSVPSLRMHRLDPKSDRVTVQWEEKLGSRGCIVSTYAVGDEYFFSSGSTFDVSQ